MKKSKGSRRPTMALRASLTAGADTSELMTSQPFEIGVEWPVGFPCTTHTFSVCSEDTVAALKEQLFEANAKMEPDRQRILLDVEGRAVLENELETLGSRGVAPGTELTIQAQDPEDGARRRKARAADREAALASSIWKKQTSNSDRLKAHAWLLRPFCFLCCFVVLVVLALT